MQVLVLVRCRKCNYGNQVQIIGNVDKEYKCVICGHKGNYGHISLTQKRAITIK